MADSLRIFVSSSMSELVPEREVACMVIKDGGLKPFLFEKHAGSRSGDPQEVWRRELQKSHRCVVILWNGLGKWTLDEIVFAESVEVPVLVFTKVEDIRDEPTSEVVRDFLREAAVPGKGFFSDKRFIEADNSPDCDLGWRPPSLRELIPEALRQQDVDDAERARESRLEDKAAIVGPNMSANDSEGDHGAKCDETGNGKRKKIATWKIRKLREHDGAFVGRKEERDLFDELIADNQRIIPLTGPEGIGRKAILQDAAFRDLGLPFPAGSGVIPETNAGEPVEDMLQSIWERFFKPPVETLNDVDRRESDLEGLQAFIALLDAELDEDDIDDLLDAMPKALFGVTVPEGHRTPGRYITVPPIHDSDQQVELFSDRSKIEVADDLREVVVTACEAVNGVPAAIRTLAEDAFNDRVDPEGLPEWLAAAVAEGSADA